GGLNDVAALNEAMARGFPIVVFSPQPIEQDATDGTGAAWKLDVFTDDSNLPDWLEPARAFFEALATLNHPLSTAEIDDFGKDFELKGAHGLAGGALVGYGGRFILRATLADALTRNLDPDRRRAAHCACLNFLNRNGFDPARSA